LEELLIYDTPDLLISLQMLYLCLVAWWSLIQRLLGKEKQLITPGGMAWMDDLDVLLFGMSLASF